MAFKKLYKRFCFVVGQETDGFSRRLIIKYPDGRKSNVCPGSIEAAKRIIDNHLKGLIRERRFKRTANKLITIG